MKIYSLQMSTAIFQGFLTSSFISPVFVLNGD